MCGKMKWTDEKWFIRSLICCLKTSHGNQVNCQFIIHLLGDKLTLNLFLPIFPIVLLKSIAIFQVIDKSLKKYLK